MQQRGSRKRAAQITKTSKYCEAAEKLPGKEIEREWRLENGWKV